MLQTTSNWNNAIFAELGLLQIMKNLNNLFMIAIEIDE